MARGWRAWRAYVTAAEGAGERLVTVVQAACVVHLFKHNVAEFTVCEGPSMLPTFHTKGDIVVVNRLVARGNADDVDVGDVVVARSPTTPGGSVCKRVMAKEGETVRTFARATPAPGERPRLVVVPMGHIWLQGDNVNNSSDSREYGPVPVALLRGRVDYRILPWQHMCSIERHIPRSWVQYGFCDGVERSDGSDGA